MSLVEPHAHVRVVGTTFLRTRPFVVAPLLVVTASLLIVAGVPRAQLASIGATAGCALTAFTIEAVRGRTRPARAGYLLVSLLATMTVLSLLCTFTGALSSPVLPMLFAPTVIAFAAFGRSGRGWTVLAYAVALAVGLSTLPPDAIFPEIPQPYRRLISLAATADALVLLWLGVASLTAAHAAAAAAAARAGEDAVAQAKVRLSVLEATAGKLAHEIKNPLAAVRGLVELSLEGDVDERTRERLGVARGEVERVELVLQEQLRFAKPLEELSRSKADARELAWDVATMLEARAQQRGVTIVVTGSSVSIDVDARRLREALLNLALNALEASKEGGGSIEIEIASSGQQVDIAVIDDGRGLDEETLRRAGEAFFTTKATGTGLGVLVARQTAEQHGGTLSLARRADGGTIATLRLPRGAVE